MKEKRGNLIKIYIEKNSEPEIQRKSKGHGKI